MKMPIVSLNTMAMNESVAATCCYAHTHVNGYAYEEVLNGGEIVVDFATSKTYIDGFDKSWLTLEGDYGWGVDGHPLEKIFNATTGKYESKVEVPGTGTYKDYNAGGTIWQYCDHSDESCAYIANIENVKTEYHVGSTVKHTAGGDKWDKSHVAVRFNS